MFLIISRDFTGLVIFTVPIGRVKELTPNLDNELLELLPSKFCNVRSLWSITSYPKRLESFKKFFKNVFFFFIFDSFILYTYFIMTIKSSQELVENALQEIKTLSVDEALKLVKEDKCNLVDIRDIRELDKQGRIDNSAHIPRGMLEFWMDPQSEYFKNGKIDMKKEIVLFCAGGLRSALVTKSLKDMGYKNVSHIEGGFSSMKNNGFKVV